MIPKEGDIIPLEEDLTCRGPPNPKASSHLQLNHAVRSMTVVYWPSFSRTNCKIVRESAVCSVP